MKVCVVTCTGGRPELFALCRRWVERQTHRPDAWIVTTDTGEVPLIPEWARHINVPAIPDGWRDLPCAGAAFALYVALTAVPEDHAVVVMEDDDWYSARHVETAMGLLRLHEIVQLERLYRFHLPARRFYLGHPGARDQRLLVPGIASFRCSAIDMVKDALQHEPFSRMPLHFYDADTCVSIKGVGHGLPGRAGATTKHQANHPKTLKGTLDTVDHAAFRRLVGNDADAYISLLR